MQGYNANDVISQFEEKKINTGPDAHYIGYCILTFKLKLKKNYGLMLLSHLLAGPYPENGKDAHMIYRKIFVYY